jgi:hypothetical protein
MSHKDFLEIPNKAKSDPKSFEIMRLWIALGDQHFSIRTGVWEDPAAWGIMLADLARHIAASYNQEEGRDIDATLRRIREGWSAELD